MKKIFFCEENDLDKNEYIVKWIDDFRDEIIIFKDKDYLFFKGRKSLFLLPV